MSSALAPPAPGVSTNDSATPEVKAIIDDWVASGHPDTLAALDRFPQLRLDKSLLMELAYEEYVLRTQAGEPVDPDQFCEQFPDYRTSLRGLLEAHQLIAGQPSALADAPAFRWPTAGDRLGEYLLQRPLGRGGFARVFLATHALTGRRVVVKVSPPNAKEPRVLGKLDHPNVVPVLDARSVDDSLMALVMPFVGASTLTDLLDEAFRPGRTSRRGDCVLRAARRNVHDDDASPTAGKVPAAFRGTYNRAIRHLATGIARGLAYLHAQEICHLDLKPSNVLLTWDGRPLIVDFNLAVDARVDLAHCGGTLYYMAPEQIQAGMSRVDDPRLDARCDVFAFGVILYELLTGLHPFSVPAARAGLSRDLRRSEFASWLLGQQRSGCLSPRTHTRDLEPGLDRLVMRCLNFDREGRPANAAEVARELDRLQSFWRRFRVPVASGALAVGLLVSGVTYHVATRPPYAERVMQSARADIRDRRFAQAINRLNEILATEGENPDAHFLRGLARLRQGDPKSAQMDIQLSAKAAPRAETLAALAYCNSATKQYAGAKEIADKVEPHFRNAALLNNRAWCRMSVPGGNLPAQLSQSRTDLDDALGMQPNLAAALYNRSYYHYLMHQNGVPGHLDSAIADVEKAFSLDGSSASLCNWAVDLIMLRNNKQEADWDLVETWIRRAVERGWKTANFKNSARFAHLRQRPNFLEFLAGPPREFIDNPLIRLADPLADLQP